jgi:hypothetical protein
MLENTLMQYKGFGGCGVRIYIRISMTAARADDPSSANLTQALNPLVSPVPPLVPVVVCIKCIYSTGIYRGGRVILWA